MGDYFEVIVIVAAAVITIPIAIIAKKTGRIVLTMIAVILLGVMTGSVGYWLDIDWLVWPAFILIIAPLFYIQEIVGAKAADKKKNAGGLRKNGHG